MKPVPGTTGNMEKRFLTVNRWAQKPPDQSGEYSSGWLYGQQEGQWPVSSSFGGALE